MPVAAVTKGDRTRRRIKDAFAALLEKKSFASITVTEICRSAEMTVGGLYFHFKSQEALLDEVMAEYAEALWKRVDQAMKEIGFARQGRAVCEAFFKTYELQPGVARAYHQLTRARSEYTQAWRAASESRIAALAATLHGDRSEILPRKARFLAYALFTVTVSQLDLAFAARERGRVGRGEALQRLVLSWSRLAAVERKRT